MNSEQCKSNRWQGVDLSLQQQMIMPTSQQSCSMGQAVGADEAVEDVLNLSSRGLKELVVSEVCGGTHQA